MITREQLEKRRRIIEADLVSKLEVRDYHGVADAAMDLRELDAKLALLASGLRVPGLDKGECDVCHQRQWVGYEIRLDQTLCLSCHERRMKATDGSTKAEPVVAMDASRAGQGFPDLEI